MLHSGEECNEFVSQDTVLQALYFLLSTYRAYYFVTSLQLGLYFIATQNENFLSPAVYIMSCSCQGRLLSTVCRRKTHTHTEEHLREERRHLLNTADQHVPQPRTAVNEGQSGAVQGGTRWGTDEVTRRQMCACVPCKWVHTKKDR